jgi:hypothetical protein
MPSFHILVLKCGKLVCGGGFVYCIWDCAEGFARSVTKSETAKPQNLRWQLPLGQLQFFTFGTEQSGPDLSSLLKV